MCPVGTALELRMELHPYKPGVAGELHDLHQPSVRGEAGEAEARSFEGLPVGVVELVAVAVALVDVRSAIGFGGEAPLRDFTIYAILEA